MNLRALTVYDHVPAGCALHPVGDDTCDPHLRIGEMALIDESDMEPQSSELYLIRVVGVFGERRRIRQLRKKKLYGTTGWWIGPLVRQAVPDKGHASIEGAMLSPVRYALSDGPLTPAGVRSYIVGRVAGVYDAPAAVRVSFSPPTLRRVLAVLVRTIVRSDFVHRL